MEVELKKSEEKFDVSDYIADEEPVTKCDALPEAEYPKEITTIAADNGYLFKIGCQVFVCEGDVDKAINALKRYLSLDSSVVQEYSCKFDRQDMLYEEAITTREMQIVAENEAKIISIINNVNQLEKMDDDRVIRPDEDKKDTSRLKTPVFSSFQHKNPDVAIFNVINGTVTLNYHTGMATVKQGFFTAHEFKSEIK